MSAAMVPPPLRDNDRIKTWPVRTARMFGTDLGNAPLPARGLFYSVVAHVLFLLATLIVPWSYWIPAPVHLAPVPSQLRAQELLLPDLEPLGGGSPSAAPKHTGGQGGSRTRQAPAPATQANSKRGVVFKGPQLIVSDSPNPDNSIQTVRQPDLAVARKLPAPLPVPPMVSIAPSVPAIDAPTPQTPIHPLQPAAIPLALSETLPKVDAPKLPLPAANAENPLQAVTSAPVSSALPKLARPAVPVDEGTANAQHNVLVVDALPVPDAKPSALPPGELHGTFTVSPMGSSAMGNAGGGTAPGGAPGNSTGTGTGTYAGVGTQSAGGTGQGNGATSGAGTGTGIAGNGQASGAPAGVGIGPGLGGNGAGAGNGTGKIAGNGAGTGSGKGSGGSSGSATGTGKSPFPGIMIQGGTSNSGGSGRTSTAVNTPSKPQPHYGGITIVANGASGGGFRDYGVFKDGISYTVYLDMNDTGLRGPDWTMQYALDSHPTADDPPPPHGVLEPPYALTKPLPHYPPEAAKRNHGATILVTGIITSNGQWEGLRVMHSPDPSLNAHVLDALTNWTFKPAEMNGSPVSVRCLLGVLVNLVSTE